MFRNYLVIALRNLRKHRLYSFITIGGLAVGLAACLMILLFVKDELSYDRWLANAERIAKLEITFKVPILARSVINASGKPRACKKRDIDSSISTFWSTAKSCVSWATPMRNCTPSAMA